MNDMRVKFTAVSSNTKTGPIPTTITEKESCPDVCPLKGGHGCYAESGHVNIHWGKVTVTGLSWSEFCQKIEALPTGEFWRHNVAGDLPHNGGYISRKLMDLLVTANKGKNGFTYTHHDVSIVSNRIAIASANAYGFTVNLSANNPAHADELAALEIGPVVTILPIDATGILFTPQRRKIVVCPATSEGSTVTCKTCQLCALPNRAGVIVGFPAHGIQKKKTTASTGNQAVISFVPMKTAKRSNVPRETIKATCA